MQKNLDASRARLEVLVVVHYHTYFISNTRKLKVSAPVFLRVLLLALVLLSHAGCVSTPQGTKFDPIEGGRRLDDSLGKSIDRLQDRSYQDVN